EPSAGEREGPAPRKKEPSAGERERPAPRKRESAEGGHVGRAVARLEEAVNDLVASAGESAAGYIDRAAERVRRQVALRKLAGEQAEPRGNYRPRPHREPAWLWSDEPRSVKLYRDTKRGKLLGVCAGIGRYYGVEVWVVRCVAITAVIFLNWLAVAAYLIAGLFVLEKEPARGKKAARRRRAKRDRRIPDEDEDQTENERRYALPSPRQQLRTVDAEFDEVELRLRRMETHITSGRYELHREFGRIGDGDSAVN
ncbi:MAG: PspC domain-containing protein, partial [Gammaproteobacteria bacterium]|nr:PspC domain-containing protein [Gammaproteobacteria bacterium]